MVSALTILRRAKRSRPGRQLLRSLRRYAEQTGGPRSQHRGHHRGDANGTALDRFQAKHPGKYFDVGIAEEHAVLFARLAVKGLKPVVAIYSTFLQRVSILSSTTSAAESSVVSAWIAAAFPATMAPRITASSTSVICAESQHVHMVPKDEDELADMLYTATLHNGPIPSGILAAPVWAWK